MGSFGAALLVRYLWVSLLSAIFLTACVALSYPAKAQDSQTQQNQPVADAARRNAEQKKSAARRPRVITNDDLDAEYFKPRQEGLNVGAPPSPQTNAPSAGAAAAKVTDRSVTSAKNESGPKGKESEEAAAEDAEIVRLKKQIAEAENDLNWQQREFALDENSYYSNPNYPPAEKAKLDSEQVRINERQREIERLKAPLPRLEWLQWRRRQAELAESASPAVSGGSAAPPTPGPSQP
jgi:hypothetical protein